MIQQWIVFLLGMLIPVSAFSFQQKIDVTKKPESKISGQIRFPDFRTTVLENGLKVFIVEDHEQPTITFRVQIGIGTIVDPEGKAGAMEMLVDMLTKGTKNRSALDIAQALDSIGASLSTSAGGDALYFVVSGLKKYAAQLLDVLADVLQNPTFPEEELQKYKQQVIAGLRYEKSQPFEVANKLARQVIYGKHHPYAKSATEESVQRITADDLRQLHRQYILPNISSIAVVGDVRESEAVALIKRFLGEWEKGEVSVVRIPDPQVDKPGVYFIERPGSVQATIIATALTVPYVHPDYEKCVLASEMLGGSFGGWFFRTLRETYGYTYTPFAFVTRAKYANRFVGAADVRNTVTDSALSVMVEQIEKLGETGPTAEELYRIQRYSVGSYLMNFESSQFVASLVQRADLFGESFEHLKAFPKRYMEYTPADVQDVARRYLERSHLRFVVVGDREILSKIGAFGDVYQFDLDLNPLAEEATAGGTVNLSVEEVLQKYRDALGGEVAIASLRSVRIESTVEMAMGGNTLSGTAVKEILLGKKGHFKTTLPAMMHEIWVANGEAWQSVMGQPAVRMEGGQEEESLRELYPFPLLGLSSLGYRLSVEGMSKGLLLLLAVSPSGSEIRYFLDPETFRLKKIERFIESPNGGKTLLTEQILEYRQERGIHFPAKIRMEMGPVVITETVNTIEINPPLSDSLFVPPKQ